MLNNMQSHISKYTQKTVPYQSSTTIHSVFYRDALITNLLTACEPHHSLLFHTLNHCPFSSRMRIRAKRLRNSVNKQPHRSIHSLALVNRPVHKPRYGGHRIHYIVAVDTTACIVRLLEARRQVSTP